MDTGRQMLSDLMSRSEKDPKDFVVAYNELLAFLEISENIELMATELKARNVKCTNFYDVCIDYIVVDSFEVSQT